MPRAEGGSLWSWARAAGPLGERWLWGAEGSVGLGELGRGSSLGGRLEELRGGSALVATRGQLTTARALIELDGGARRPVVRPPAPPLGAGACTAAAREGGS